MFSAQMADGAVVADTAPELPEDLTREESEALLSRLSDEQVREILLHLLEKNREEDETAEEEDAIDEVYEEALDVKKGAAALLRATKRLPEVPRLVWANVTQGGTVSGATFLIGILFLFGIGWGAEALYRRVTKATVRSRVGDQIPGIMARLGVLVLGALIDFVGIAIFSLFAFGASLLVAPESPTSEIFFVTLISVVVVVRLVSVIARKICVPEVSWLRLVPFGDAAAQALYRGVMVLTVILTGYELFASLLEELALDYYLVELIRFGGSLIFMIVLCALVWNARLPVAEYFGAGENTDLESRSLREGLAANWHVLVIAYVIGIWTISVGYVMAGGEEPLYPGMASLLLVAALPLVDLGLQRIVQTYFAKHDESGESVPESNPSRDDETHADTEEENSSTSGYQELALRNLRIVLGIMMVFILAEVWGVNLRALSRDMVGGRLAGAFVDISLAAVMAYAVWGIVNIAIQQRMMPAGGADGERAGEPGGTGKSRLDTMFPLFAKFIRITLIVMVVMISLSELGVDIGPLIAGAGVVGIAVGFGAQSLVRDVVSGLFFLLDDAFRMDEYVEIDTIRGKVQRISTRSLQLRHHNGPVHTIPFGTINHITNYSRDWTIMKFEFRIPFETDVDRVRKIVKRVGLEMMEDEQLRPLLLEPMKSQGVNRMDDSALIIRCKFTAIPGQQFFIRREAYTRIQKAFEEEGIHFAPRRVIVETGSGAPLPASAAQAAAGVLDREGENPPKVDDRG